MPYDTLQSAISRADFKASALERSVHISSDGTVFYVEAVDAEFGRHPIIHTVHPTPEDEEYDRDDGDEEYDDDIPDDTCE